jgi:hypothetical protein
MNTPMRNHPSFSHYPFLSPLFLPVFLALFSLLRPGSRQSRWRTLLAPDWGCVRAALAAYVKKSTGTNYYGGLRAAPG